MSPQDETKRMLETSEARRNKRVDDLLADPAVKAVLEQDQHAQATLQALIDATKPVRKFG